MMMARHDWFEVIFVFLLYVPAVVVGPGAIEEAPLKLIQGCTPELLHVRSYRHLQSICRSQPSLAVSAYEGIEDAMEECREQMRFQPWDCSQPSILYDPLILRYGYRESAYVWAMSAAGAAWGVATACAQGWLPECSCGDVDDRGEQIHRQTKNWAWAGCSYGVHYGIATSRRLLTRHTPQRSPLRAVERHNLKAGRLAVKKTLISSCKCHGVSGSCQQRTCWKRASDLGAIASHLKAKFQKAQRVSINDSVDRNRPADLIYIESSPDSCHLPSGNNRNRVCNERNATHSQGNCERLCCGRGFSVNHESLPFKCDCKFVWCCKVVCNDCLQHRWVSTCN